MKRYVRKAAADCDEVPKKLQPIFGKHLPPVPKHEVDEHLLEITGAYTDALQGALIRQALKSQCEKDPDFPLWAAVNALHELRPQNAADGMVAVQTIQAHTKALECWRRASEDNRTPEEIDMYLRHAAAITRLEIACLDRLDKSRQKPKKS